MSPGPLSIPLGSFRLFSKFCRDNREWIFISGVNDTSNKLFGGVVDTGYKFRLFGYLSPVSTTPGKNVIAGVVVTGDNCLPVSLITAKNLSAVSLAIIVHRCCWYRRKIYHWCRCHRRSSFTGVIDIGNKFIASAVVTGDHRSPVSLILAIHLSPVLLSQAIIVHRCRWYWWKIYPQCRCHRQSFFSGVNDTVDKFVGGIVDTADKHSFLIISVNFRKKSKWS